MKKLAGEIQQSQPFESLETEALLNLQRTWDEMRRQSILPLKPHGLTGPQYNVLRILRGAEPDGLPCSEIGKRMVSHDPDITRLLKRLDRLGLTRQRRDLRDRRVVHTRITETGLQRLKVLDPLVKKGAKQALGHLGAGKLSTLIELLEEARGADNRRSR